MLMDGDDDDDMIKVLPPVSKWKNLTIAPGIACSKKTKKASPVAGGLENPGVAPTKEVGYFDDSKQIKKQPPSYFCSCQAQ